VAHGEKPHAGIQHTYQILNKDSTKVNRSAIGGAAPPPVDELAAILNIQEFQAAGSSGWPPAYSRRWLAASTLRLHGLVTVSGLKGV
jgi:hypothetical protein